MGASANSSSLSPVMAKQIRPRACVAMKLMASGVIISAAMVRSPLFSRFFVVDNNDHASSLDSQRRRRCLRNSALLDSSHRCSNRIDPAICRPCVVCALGFQCEPVPHLFPFGRQVSQGVRVRRGFAGNPVNDSPVRHCEWIRTSGGSPVVKSPIFNATASSPLLEKP